MAASVPVGFRMDAVGRPTVTRSDLMSAEIDAGGTSVSALDAAVSDDRAGGTAVEEQRRGSRGYHRSVRSSEGRSPPRLRLPAKPPLPLLREGECDGSSVLAGVGTLPQLREDQFSALQRFFVRDLDRGEVVCWIEAEDP